VRTLIAPDPDNIGGLMGAEQEAAVHAFMAELDGEDWDSARIDRAVNRMAADARYQIHAGDEPFVGHDAIRAEFLRQTSTGMSDLRAEIVTIGSVGQIVFTERLDSLTLNDKPVSVHIAGVYEVDAEGKIAAWRDYFNSGEIAVQLGADASNAEERDSRP
jgi:limonene-1,2-epoxide hydrolase